MKGLAIKAVDDLQSSFAATLDDANNDTLVALVSFPAPPLFSAYPCFINFDFATQLRRANLSHCGADSVAEIPSSLVRNADGTLDLVSRDALF
ncbi:hypothetical protein MYX19_04560 [Nitrospinae bacterium AH-259-F20]|nr:hypothetical protein [Nitrospinae bacterium AH-259-F20]